MDIWGALSLFFIIFFIMSCCGYCCTTKRRGAVLSAPVVITSTTHTTPSGFTVTQTNGYTAGYPTQVNAMPPQNAQNFNQMQMPMPMPMPTMQAPGMQQNYGPYPSTAGAYMNPPTYDVAMAAPTASQPYDKQHAYNPNYTAQ